MARKIAAKKTQNLKRYIKFLATNPAHHLLRESIRVAPTPVIKVISNAALNAQRGEIPISSANKKKFSKQRKLFNSLTSKSVGVEQKRKNLIQSGGSLAIIPLLLSTVLGSIGSALFQ